MLKVAAAVANSPESPVLTAGDMQRNPAAKKTKKIPNATPRSVMAKS